MKYSSLKPTVFILLLFFPSFFENPGLLCHCRYHSSYFPPLYSLHVRSFWSKVSNLIADSSTCSHLTYFYFIYTPRKSKNLDICVTFPNCILFPTMTRKKFLTAHNYDYKMATSSIFQSHSLHFPMFWLLYSLLWINVVALLQLKAPLTSEKQVWLFNSFL